MIEQVSPHAVPVSSEPHWRDVYAQAERLEQEGQVEPILLRADGTPDPDSWAYADAQVEPILLRADGTPDPDSWAYADAQVMAARSLEWPVILITRKDTSS